mgnify:CR=1 FL=1
MNLENERPDAHWRNKLHEIVFEAETPAGRAFDLIVISLILLSVFVVLLESVKSVRENFGETLFSALDQRQKTSALCIEFLRNH